VVSERVTGRRGKVQKRNRSKLAGWLVLGLAVVAVVAPSAQARVLAPQSNGAVAMSAGASTIRASDQFDWRAAGVLAGVGVALSITIGAALMARSRDARLANS
jgi:multisubunit Na+/H+ antiporter MnhB subunit